MINPFEDPSQSNLSDNHASPNRNLSSNLSPDANPFEISGDSPGSFGDPFNTVETDQLQTSLIDENQSTRVHVEMDLMDNPFDSPDFDVNNNNQTNENNNPHKPNMLSKKVRARTLSQVFSPPATPARNMLSRRQSHSLMNVEEQNCIIDQTQMQTEIFASPSATHSAFPDRKKANNTMLVPPPKSKRKISDIDINSSNLSAIPSGAGSDDSSSNKDEPSNSESSQSSSSNIRNLNDSSKNSSTQKSKTNDTSQAKKPPKSPEYAEKKIKQINKKINNHEKKIARLKKKREKLSKYLTVEQKGKLIIVNDDNGTPTDKTEVKDALAFMLTGSSMLKYGRFGYPHFRHFEVSPDCTRLMWYSSGKNLSKTTINLLDVDVLQTGQLTNVFKKHLQPRLSKCSFSLVYNAGNKTLDVIAKNRNEFLLWTTGLTKLIDYNKRKSKHSEQDTQLPSCINVRVPKRNAEMIEKKLNSQPDPPKKIVDKELEMANKAFNKVSELMRHPNVCESSKFPVILQKTVQLEKDLEKATRMMDQKSLSVASHEIWRTCVEIKALDNKLTVLSKQK